MTTVTFECMHINQCPFEKFRDKIAPSFLESLQVLGTNDLIGLKLNAEIENTYPATAHFIAKYNGDDCDDFFNEVITQFDAIEVEVICKIL